MGVPAMGKGFTGNDGVVNGFDLENYLRFFSEAI